MPDRQLRFRPGIDIEATPALNEGGYSSSNLVRFKAGLAQKLGGWVRYLSQSVGSNPRALHAWNDLNNVGRLAVGSANALNVIQSGIATTITPQTLASSFALDFSTTSGSAVVAIVDGNTANLTLLDSVIFDTPISVGGLILSGVYAITLITGTTNYQITASALATATVAHGGAVPAFATILGTSSVMVTLANHGLSVGGTFVSAVSTAVGGVTVLGTYSVATVQSSSAFTITVAALATSTTSASMNAGNARVDYIISLGPPAAGVGYGLGTYGTGGYGLGTVAAAQVGNPITVTDWTLDNWGELLICCADGGGIYYWGPNRGLATASLVSTGPVFNSGLFISMPAQILVTWGSTLGPGVLSNAAGQIGALQDPMLIQWSDQLDFTKFVPSTTNQAGNFRIPRGSKIISCVQGPNQAYVWTDIGCWSMQYQGINNFVFGFTEIGQGCGLIAKHARCVLRSAVYYMSQNNFYVLQGGSPQIIPCTVWDAVFQDLDTTNSFKCAAVANSLFSEIEFYFPSLSGGTGENDKCVKLNVLEGTWDISSIARSAGIDHSVLGTPIKVASTGIIYQHETGNDADGSPMLSFIETGLAKISEGNAITFVDLIYPDMKWITPGNAVSAQVQMTITAYDTPNSAGVSVGPYMMTSTTEFIPTRLRGRFLKIRIESSDSGTFWRMGGPTYRYAVDGRR